MSDVIEKIVTIKFEDNDLLASIRELNSYIEENQAKQRALANERKSGAVTNEQYVKSLVALQEQERLLKGALTNTRKELRTSITEQKLAAGSYNALQKQLRTLVQDYKALSEAERESEGGSDKLKQIAETTAKLKELDKGMGVFNRTVGDYESAFNSGKWGQFAAQISNISPAFARASQAVSAGAQRINIALSTGPLIAISALVVAITSIARAFRTSEQASMSLKVAFAPLTGVMNVFTASVQKAAEWVGELMAKISGKLVEVIGGSTTKMAEQATAMYNIVERENQLIKDRRDNIVASAEDELTISELRYKAQRKDLYTAEERLKFIKEASALQLKRAEEEKRLAEEAAAIQAEKMKQTSNSAEEEDKLAELRAAAFQAEKKYFDQQREMSEKIVSFTAEIEAEKEAALKAEQERAAKYEAIEQRVQDATLAMMAEGAAKQEALARRESEKRLAALEKEYAEGIMSAEQYETLRAQIEQETTDKIAEIQENATEEAYKKRVAAQQLDYENELLRAELDGQNVAAVKLAQLQKQREQLAELETTWNSHGYESEAAYQNAILKLDQSIAAQREQIAKDSAKTRKMTEQDYLGAVSDITGAIMGIVDTQGEQSERQAAFAKTLALFQIGIQTAQGLAAAVAQGAGVKFPANLAAIASGMVAVLTGIASAKAALSDAGSAPKYHDGGLVQGNGEVAAVLLNDEAVMNRAAVANFGGLLSELNVASGGNAITAPADTAVGDSYISTMLRRALEDMPTPVVSVVEITKAQNSVRAIQMRARRAHG